MRCLLVKRYRDVRSTRDMSLTELEGVLSTRPLTPLQAGLPSVEQLQMELESALGNLEIVGNDEVS